MTQNTPKIVIGTEYFPKFIQNDALFVDKSLLIKDIINDGSESVLITRPRRWGKSLNMSMIQHFFSPNVGGQATQGLFDDLEIDTADNGHYMQYQGQFPAIYITFKDIEVRQYDQIMEHIHYLISKLFNTFPELSHSNKLTPVLQKEYHDISYGQASATQMQNALLTLSECLHMHYGQRVYILIDEYDKPLNTAYRYNYFEELLNFFKAFFGTALKGNRFLEKSLLTGILRLAKAGLFSGLNNFQEYTLLDNNYSKHFGFTEKDVSFVFERAGLAHDIDKIKAWYNGYKVGDDVLYNPWSIMSCAKQHGQLRSYWVDTADNRLIKQCLIESSEPIKRDLKVLLEGRSINAEIQRYVTFDDLENDPAALWSLLLYAGYLRIDAIDFEGGLAEYPCKISIPNKEVLLLFNGFIVSWVKRSLGCAKGIAYLEQLLSGQVPQFTHTLRSYLMTAASAHDTGNNSELFYHGFLLASVIQLRETHHIRSNRESGFGRYDMIIIPKTADISDLGIVLEFKRVSDDSQLVSTAKKALEQIDLKRYDEELRTQPHIRTILRIGMAFSGKAVVSAYQTFCCQDETRSEVTVSECVD